MAKCEILAPFLLFWEGRGFTNDPDDPGGATMNGVTLNTFRSFYGASKTVSDLKKITDAQWTEIFKKGFWDKCKADEIKSQSVANMIVDWCYNAGAGNVIPRVQRLVGTTADGKVGPKTIAAINAKTPRILLEQLRQTREQYYRTRATAWKYLNGWLNRTNSITYGSLKYGGSQHPFPDI